MGTQGPCPAKNLPTPLPQIPLPRKTGAEELRAKEWKDSVL